MENFFEIPESDLPMTARAIRNEIKKRNYPAARYFFSTFSYIEITRPDGKIVKVNSSTPSTSSSLACMLATDKLAAYKIMSDLSGISQPETQLLPVESATHRQIVTDMLKRHKTLVIKPIDGAHGNDVYTNITSFEQAEKIIANISANSQSQRLLVQEQLPEGELETRVLCIDFHYVAAYHRIPAAVTGDGIHKVYELIDIENSTIRTAPYKGILNYIDKSASTKYLSEKQIADYIPKKGEKVQVVGICNAGKGGTMEDVTKTLPQVFRDTAEKIATGFDLPVIGVDFYGDKVIEVNCGPALYYPDICIEKYVDYLEKI